MNCMVHRDWMAPGLVAQLNYRRMLLTLLPRWTRGVSPFPTRLHCSALWSKRRSESQYNYKRGEVALCSYHHGMRFEFD